MPDDNLLDDVKQWLDRNGYRLELATARTLMKYSPVSIDQGAQYVDPNTGVLREIDVVASWGKIGSKKSWHMSHVYVECKNTTSPWIGFLRAEDDAGSIPDYGYVGGCETCTQLGSEIGAWARIGTREHAYAVVEKRNPEKGSRDLAREAVLSVASAVRSAQHWILAEHAREKEEYDDQDHRFDSCIPVVVTTSPLFACSLDANGDVTLTRVEELVTSLTPDPASEPMLVTICTADRFEARTEELVAILHGVPGGTIERHRGGRGAA